MRLLRQKHWSRDPLTVQYGLGHGRSRPHKIGAHLQRAGVRGLIAIPPLDLHGDGKLSFSILTYALERCCAGLAW